MTRQWLLCPTEPSRSLVCARGAQSPDNGRPLDVMSHLELNRGAEERVELAGQFSNCVPISGPARQCTWCDSSCPRSSVEMTSSTIVRNHGYRVER